MALTSDIVLNDVTVEYSQTMVRNFAGKRQNNLEKVPYTVHSFKNLSSYHQLCQPWNCPANLILERIIRIFCFLFVRSSVLLNV